MGLVTMETGDENNNLPPGVFDVEEAWALTLQA